MLSPNTIAIIKSTVPVLEVHGTAITRRFYQRLFEACPELLNLFNQANQKQERQQAALANAVYAAALHIDKLETILPTVRHIAHKHRSLGVTADQYAVVGENLLAAMSDVLGEAATEEILQAWAEAYGIIAGVFIEVEKDLYRQAEEAKGGWAGDREFKVERKISESEQVASFYLTPSDGGQLPAFLPGQYISIKLSIPGEEHTHIRQYSLSDAPGKSYYRITVKREDGVSGNPAGKVSNYLHRDVKEGDTLLLSAPAGSFTLKADNNRPIVLISNGIGLTPMLSMLESLALAGEGLDREVVFIHATRSHDDHVQFDRVQDLLEGGSKLTVCWSYSNLNGGTKQSHALQKQLKPGRIDSDWLHEFIPSGGASYYFCGSVPFMRDVYQALKAFGVSDEDINYEFFGPAGDLTGSEAKPSVGIAT